jgi:uncharacterized protein YkwD
MLELINRMRSQPSAELDLLLNSGNSSVNFALDFFNVDLNVLRAQWLSLEAVQPLAWSGELYDAAINHNERMIQQDTQSHRLSGELALGDRIAATGYNWSTVGENIYAFSNSVFHGHAGFAIDWGFSPTGIQPSHSHRNNIMNNNFREVGLSVTPENNPTTSVGSLVVTQNFGSRFNFGNSWLLGVVFDDRTVDDNFYTSGEGLAEVAVTAVNIATEQSFTTTTWNAGGYQMQLPGGTYQVTFSGDWNGDGHLDTAIKQVTVGSENVKLDLNTEELVGIPVPTPEPAPTPTPEPTPIPTPEPDGDIVTPDRNIPVEDATADNDGQSGSGNDTIAGGLGNDVIYGTDGEDVLRGDLNSRSSGGSLGGDDIIYGGKGSDRIGGKGGSDRLYGEEGNDSIWGDDGDDLLWGGLGDDTLTGDDFSGGRGRDTFVLAAGEGIDTVIDFQIGEDFLGLADGLTFEELSVSQGTGADADRTLISFDGEMLAVINGINANNLMVVADTTFTAV